jgi:outer membrane protein OmpA-like peptidoglycan-associated protein
VVGGLLVPAYGDPTDPAPVVDVVAPVVDISFATSDLQGAARVEEDDQEIKVTLSSEVLFAKDSAKLRPGIIARLRQIAEALTAKGPGRVAIVGYTDDLGSATHGLTLSRARANAVARALRPLLDRADYPFAVSGKGESDPAVPNDSEANRRLNRRVELTFRPGPAG